MKPALDRTSVSNLPFPRVRSPLVQPSTLPRRVSLSNLGFEPAPQTVGTSQRVVSGSIDR
eukprot:scaffold752_cov322-Pavlova_lutheri.AAC.61